MRQCTVTSERPLHLYYNVCDILYSSLIARMYIILCQLMLLGMHGFLMCLMMAPGCEGLNGACEP